MIKNILNLDGTHQISRTQQKSIKGGIGLPSSDDCGCIVMGSHGYLEIIAVSCSNTCPDGSTPKPGLGS
ncbi:hypothetical protein [Aquimarina mytili]|uniref:Uncharacterized protein n=1 Tax=Aquimarina mytili TaxID=874423 RepID=A0A937A3C5_9FLAO|nr:hypothetical protein [Aquimarina mytili]MBL0686116.1 hypothetical protein [Aquimarina mytili]